MPANNMNAAKPELTSNKKSMPWFLIKNLFIIKYIIFLSLIFTNCIEKYEPQHNDFNDLLVISGSIIKGDSIQTVTISRSTPYNNSSHDPIGNCEVWAINEFEQEFHFEESKTGVYKIKIPEQFLNFNSQFKLRVNTPDGNEYESSYEPILESSPVDIVYYEEESFHSSSVDYPNGLQFYLDLKAPSGFSRKYRWKLEETWEYHTHKIYGEISPVDTTFFYPPKDSISKCWRTIPVVGLYSSSTENLSLNEKKKIPLNYVPKSSIQLNYGYSLLVKQYALSDVAYEYWNRHQFFINESGGLYDKQPSQSKSNIYNINNSDEIILGLFWAASFTQKRVFFKGPLGNIIINQYCELDTLNKKSNISGVNYFGLLGFKEIGDSRIPIYGTAPKKCFDCQLQGGTNIKPIFWED